MKADRLIRKIDKVSAENGKVVLVNSAAKVGLSRNHLAKMVKDGILERIEYGVYVKSGELGDELLAIQRYSQKIVYSHETALFLLGLSDRSPIIPSITVPSSYNASKPVKDRCKIYYVKPELINIGKIGLPSGMGNKIMCYDAERTICDVVRSRGRIDVQIFTDALKKYTARPNYDLNRLSEYAKLFSVYKLINQYLEVLL